ncbi:hypothetical protein ERJ75_001590000 [Trypanosoma vivax]|uniref:SET domain-containing protein n=1 Tax=Trypanosoma vivax (strain Y486) TaxID=1055687 RepID=G0TSA2_TRYVY|nr:hypothetical protein TRVL_04393 [Trypanosoma vivax]KAH8605511.1 hypothetical protein ERJ75_001590000 [Trypanosoma vivax]CCC46828.1 conserved hypothetical protein [Trypanosoma vivax Y486]
MRAGSPDSGVVENSRLSTTGDNFNCFWTWCAQNGIVSKRLSIRRGGQKDASQLSLHVDEPVRAGTVVLSVPYLVTLNPQTVRGDLRPTAMPPVRTMCRCLLRRNRMDIITAHGLWLAGCLACFGRLLAHNRKLDIAPMLSPALFPELPSPFRLAHVDYFPAIADVLRGESNGTLSESSLAAYEKRTESQLRLTHGILQLYRRRRVPHVRPEFLPSLLELRMAHRTILQRSVLLPANCIPSAPGDLADLFEESPDLETIPSLVPLVDIIRSPLAAIASGEKTEVAPAVKAAGASEKVVANCSLHTCTQADFLSPGTRRRVVIETSVLSNRRIVVCALCDLKVGEELLLNYGS